MSNICSSKVVFVGGQESISDIADKLRSVVGNYQTAEFSHIQKLFGVEGNYSLRGALTDVDDAVNPFNRGFSFVVWVDTAWTPELDLFEAIADKYGDVEIAYVGVEPGCCVFMVKDDFCFFDADYYVHSVDEDEIPDCLRELEEGIYSASELRDALSSAFGIEKALPELIAMATANDAISIDAFETVA